MAKLVTNSDEVTQLESLYPGEDRAYGTPYLPRNFTLPMSELLQWPENIEKNSDYKKPGYQFKDRIAKSRIL